MLGWLIAGWVLSALLLGALIFVCCIACKDETMYEAQIKRLEAQVTLEAKAYGEAKHELSKARSLLFAIRGMLDEGEVPG